MLLYLIVYNLMSGYSYLKCWTIYRKTNELPHPQSIICHKPSNRYELTFDLEIAAQIALLSTLDLQQFSHSPATKALLEYSQFRNVKDILNIDYINSLNKAYQEIRKEEITPRERTVWDLLLGVVIQIVGDGRYQIQEGNLQYMRLLGQTVLVIKKNRNIETGNAIKVIKEWWSYKQWKNVLSDSLIELLVLWILKQCHSNQLKDQTAEQSHLFAVWLKQVNILLSRIGIIDYQVVSSVVSESKHVTKLFLQKGHKPSGQIMVNLKQQLFKQKYQAQVFATIFAVLQAVANELSYSLLQCQDLLENQQLYSYLYYLHQTDRLHNFIAFHSFMRQHSVMGVLILNRSLTIFMNQISSSMINQALQDKDLHIMGDFNIRPISTARAVLTHFLHLSGIFISETTKAAKQRPIIKQLKLCIPDPLQFLLIKKQFWEDKFGYQVIGLAMWVICEGYCTEVQAKARDFPENKVNEYLKKLKIALCLFLLGLKYPTKMLQFVPFEGDIAWDFALLRVLPGMLMDCGYFFSSFHRDSLAFQKRVDFGPEGDILTWATIVTAQKHIPVIIHNHRGYQFFEAVLSNTSQNNFKLYAQAILNSLSIALRNMGLSADGLEDQRKKGRARLSIQIRQQLLRLLQKIASGAEKLGESAAQLRSLLVD